MPKRTHGIRVPVTRQELHEAQRLARHLDMPIAALLRRALKSLELQRIKEQKEKEKDDAQAQ